MTDTLHRFTFDGLPMRGQWVRLQGVLADATANRKYPDAISELLAKQLAAVSMFADSLKFQGAVALQSKGDGALIRSLAECREQHKLRGIAHLDEELPLPGDANLSSWLGNGQLAKGRLIGVLRQNPEGLLASLIKSNRKKLFVILMSSKLFYFGRHAWERRKCF